MEIKKAWNQMKKDLEKELGIKYGFVMNKKQIEKRTATKVVCTATPYDEEIDRTIKDDFKIQGFKTWTEEEKHNAHLRAMELVNYLTIEEEKYGTKENQAKQERDAIFNSKAFKKFEEAIGNAVCIVTEIDSDNCYRLRFYY